MLGSAKGANWDSLHSQGQKLSHLDTPNQTSLPVFVCFFFFLQELEMNKNLIEEVTHEALRGCIHLRVLDLSHNLLHEQGIDTRAWTHLKYVHPSIF